MLVGVCSSRINAAHKTP
uniref:Uncharacterized protein n=1 Tax=Arundo donax TaxID=35708 RepID=A0A0A9BN35_ARUDO